MTQRSAPAPFLTKTYQLVDDERTNDVISWSESGETFVVWKQADFAKDLLPNYFKHNNFSSFVRQLNTYGFRKIVPDKWEFSNDFFKRGRKELLCEIKRRKTLTSGKSGSGGGGNSASNSGAGYDVGSTSTSSGSAEAAKTVSPEYAELSGENEKLRKDNEMLSLELAEAKKQCEELVSFLREYLKVGPDQISRIMMTTRQGTSGSSREEGGGGGQEDEDETTAKAAAVGEGGENLKLFGVWMRGEKETMTKEKEEEKLRSGYNHKNKKGREEKMAFTGAHPSKKLKTNSGVHFGGSPSPPVNVMIN